MKKLFKEVKDLNKDDAVSIALALCKLFEESGELAQAVNMLTGRKSTTARRAKIIDHIAEECADTIQNVFCIADKAGISYADICSYMTRKNAKWRNKITKKKNKPARKAPAKAGGKRSKLR